VDVTGKDMSPQCSMKEPDSPKWNELVRKRGRQKGKSRSKIDIDDRCWNIRALIRLGGLNVFLILLTTITWILLS
jgi:hypothetical protein